MWKNHLDTHFFLRMATQTAWEWARSLPHHSHPLQNPCLDWTFCFKFRVLHWEYPHRTPTHRIMPPCSIRRVNAAPIQCTTKPKRKKKKKEIEKRQNSSQIKFLLGKKKFKFWFFVSRKKWKTPSARCTLQQNQIEIWSGYGNQHPNLHATDPLTNRHKTLTLNGKKRTKSSLELPRIYEFLGEKRHWGKKKEKI